MATELPETMGLHLIYSTVRIEASGPSGTSVGTAFGYMPILKDGVAPFLVTNRHVIEGATEGRFFFTKAAGNDPSLGPLVGQRIDITIGDFHKGWTFHHDPEVDVAVMEYGALFRQMVADGNRPYFRPLAPSAILTEGDSSSLRPFEDVFFIGYPTGLADEHNLLPLVRHGITATPPAIDYEGTPRVLIDASVFPGSSGSPVFLGNTATLAQSMKGSAKSIKPIKLLGLVSSVFLHHDEGEIIENPIPTAQGVHARFAQMIDVGIVLKSTLIQETIEHALSTHVILPPPPNWPN